MVPPVTFKSVCEDPPGLKLTLLFANIPVTYISVPTIFISLSKSPTPPTIAVVLPFVAPINLLICSTRLLLYFTKAIAPEPAVGGKPTPVLSNFTLDPAILASIYILPLASANTLVAASIPVFPNAITFCSCPEELYFAIKPSVEVLPLDVRRESAPGTKGLKFTLVPI